MDKTNNSFCEKPNWKRKKPDKCRTQNRSAKNWNEKKRNSHILLVPALYLEMHRFVRCALLGMKMAKKSPANTSQRDPKANTEKFIRKREAAKSKADPKKGAYSDVENRQIKKAKMWRKIDSQDFKCELKTQKPLPNGNRRTDAKMWRKSAKRKCEKRK